MIRAALVLLLVAASAQAETVVIRNDYGGNVLEYQARRRELAEADRVEIRGRCDSACTIFLTLPNACVGPGATLGFHGARPKTGIPPVDLFLDMQIGQFYRAGVRETFLKEWRFRSGPRDLALVRARDLVKLDPGIRLCERPRRP